MSKRFYLLLVVALLSNEFKPVKVLMRKKSKKQPTPRIAILTVITLLSIAWELYKVVCPSTFPEDLKKGLEKLEAELEQVNSKLDDLHRWQEDIMDHIQEIPTLFHHVLNIREMEKHLVRLRTLFEDYHIYSQNLTKFENATILEYAKTVTSHQYGDVAAIVSSIHTAIQPANPTLWPNSILFGMAKALQTTSFNAICSLGQSPQQVVFSFYTHTVLVRAMSVVLRIFGYSILKLFNKGKFDTEIQEMRHKYEDDVLDEIEVVKRAILPLDRRYWKCDPSVHIKGETYVELTNFHTIYVQNERDLNKGLSCTKSCETLPNPIKSYNCTEPLCKQQRICKGSLHSCHFHRKHIVVCLAPNNETRRYTSVTTVTLKKAMDNWHEHPENWKEYTVSGKKCPKNATIIPVASFQDNKKYNCHYCVCHCNEEGEYSDRYFNLRPVMADYKNNRVVTGMRIIKHNRIIHLQIQEGELEKDGLVNASTVRWVPPADYQLNDSNIKQGKDYHTLTGNHNGIYLEALKTQKKEDVIVGVGFIISPKDKYLRLSIAISSLLGSKRNLKTARKQPRWIYHTEGRGQVSMPKPDPSYYGSPPSVPHKYWPSYIRFVPSDGRKDAAQSVVPTFDAQPVYSQEPVALVSIGLFFKWIWGFGGFIAPEIQQYNFAQNLQRPKKTTKRKIKKQRKKFG